LALLTPAFTNSAQQNPAPSLPPREAICGFLGPHYYYEATAVKRGLAADLFVGEAQINHPVNLRFFLSQKPRDFPVDDLQVEHEKLIHVIGVRDDLNEFFHIHPLKVGPGLWLVTHTFTHGGNYKIWSDVKYHGTSYSFAQPTLTVSGSLGGVETNHDPRKIDVRSGYQITLKHSEPLLVGRTNQLQFSIQDPSGNNVLTENFLGSAMHLVIVSDDLSVYLHAHAETHGPATPTTQFYQVFPKTGTYKLFAQFRPQPTTLPVGEAILAEFYVNVAAGESISAGPIAK
jgi:hypothetical protein